MFGRGDKTTGYDGLPNYLTSRDAIVPVIEKQNLSTQLNIVIHIYQMRCIKSGKYWTNSDVAEIMLASAEQLSEALLRATGKWKN
jgi:hypothetical protein